METFEIAWFSSAFVFAYLVYALEPFEPPERPKNALIPIKANGRDIHVPPALVDVISDISKFATKFELALKKAVPDLKSSSGSLWTARIIRGKKPELEQALRGMDGYVQFLSEVLWRVDLQICSLRRDYSALLDRTTDAYDHGKVIKEDLKDYRKKQRAKMNEIQVGPPLFIVETPGRTERTLLGAYEGVLAGQFIMDSPVALEFSLLLLKSSPLYPC